MNVMDELSVDVAPAGRRPQRLVIVSRCGMELHRDNLDTNSGISRDRLVRAVSKRIGVNVDSLAALDGLIVDAADKADADLEAKVDGERRDDREARSQASQLVELCQCAELIHDSENVPFAVVPVGDHRETLRIGSKIFRRWLSHAYYSQGGKTPSSQAIQDAISALEGAAVFDGHLLDVRLRVGGELDRIIIDLCNASWQAVVIDRNGWRIVDDSPIRFRRARGMLNLPMPVKGGTFADLRKYVNVAEEHWPLIVGWLLAALRPVGPYPVLCLHGEQGSAKSTTAKLLRCLIDPNVASLRSPPREERDLVVAANNGWAVSLENVSHVSDWLSDALCRLSTGGGYSARELYSDGDEAIFNSQRPVMLNGIEDLATRSDLVDRSLLITLPTIQESKRMTEANYWRNFDRISGSMFGALLDAVSASIRNLNSTSLESLPRMADFAVWVTAAETSLGWRPGYFLQAYERNRRGANELAIESSIVAEAVKDFVQDRQDWQGTATELLFELNQCGDDATKRQRERNRDWPKQGRSLAGKLRRHAPNLRRIGLDVQFDLPRRELRIRSEAFSIVTIVQPCAENESAGMEANAGSDALPGAHDAHDGIPTQSSDRNGAQGGFGSCEHCRGDLIGTKTDDGFFNRQCSKCGKDARCVRAG